jgi:carboxylesterase type B
VEILIGWNENDGTVFVPSTINSTAYFSAVVAALFPGLSQSNLQTLGDLYPEDAFSDYPSEGIDRNFFRAAQVVRDANFACPSLRLATTLPPSSAYVYALNESVFTLGHAFYNRSFVGIDHFSDMPYVLDYVAKAPYSSVASQADYDMAAHMSGSWAAFATHGHPTAHYNANKTFSDWPSTGGGAWLRVLGGPRDGASSIGSTYGEELPARCAFWGQSDVLAQTYA